MKLDRKQWYNDLKREVAMTLSRCLFGDISHPFGKRRHLSTHDKQQISGIMRELDETFKQHGVDWKLTEAE
jgi:hypothetical protein